MHVSASTQGDEGIISASRRAARNTSGGNNDPEDVRLPDVAGRRGVVVGLQDEEMAMKEQQLKVSVVRRDCVCLLCEGTVRACRVKTARKQPNACLDAKNQHFSFRPSGCAFL